MDFSFDLRAAVQKHIWISSNFINKTTEGGSKEIWSDWRIKRKSFQPERHRFEGCKVCGCAHRVCFAEASDIPLTWQDVQCFQISNELYCTPYWIARAFQKKNRINQSPASSPCISPIVNVWLTPFWTLLKQWLKLLKQRVSHDPLSLCRKWSDNKLTTRSSTRGAYLRTESPAWFLGPTVWTEELNLGKKKIKEVPLFLLSRLVLYDGGSGTGWSDKRCGVMGQ
jgi:hypothetical protein